jgi:geranylgeranyl diphosphate synthase, type II
VSTQAASVSAPASLQADFSRYRAMTLEGLLAAVPSREPRRYLYDPLAAHLSRIGKGIRPALCMATCQAFGGRESQALQSAVALEMLHNAFLVHDDVEDESELRHGRPTMRAEHGMPIAVNAGDMLNALSLKLLRENLPVLGPKLTRRIFEEVDHLMRESLEGQALELGWIRDNRCDLVAGDYFRMALKKTCWYSFIHPCRIGALIATRDTVELDRFNRFGYYLGLAFQIRDDLLNLIGDGRKYGKEIGGDLLEGKRTLMLLHLLRAGSPADTMRLRGFLSQPRAKRGAKDVEWAIERMHRYGSIGYARSVARHFAGATLYEFSQAYGAVPDSAHKRFLRDIILYMVSRDL